MVKMKWTGHEVERAGLLVRAGDVIDTFESEAESLIKAGLAEPVNTAPAKAVKTAKEVSNG